MELTKFDETGETDAGQDIGTSSYTQWGDI